MAAKSTMLCTANHSLRIVRKSRPAATGTRGRVEERWRVLVEVDFEGPDDAWCVLARPRRVGVLGRIEDIHARWREAGRLRIRAQATVRTEERAIGQNRQIGASLIEHEVAETRRVDRRRAEHGHDGDDCRPMQPLVPDRTRLLRRPPDDHCRAARDERTGDLPWHPHRREADDERRPGQTRREHQHQRSIVIADSIL